MKREYTATVFILQDDKVLLIFHRKFQKWHPPGGHLLPNESPTEGAIRETMEETGLEITLISEEEHWFEQSHLSSLERPYLCLLETIEATAHQEAHQHVDFVYLGMPIGGTATLNNDETAALRWFTWEEVQALDTTEIFPDVRAIIEKIFSPNHRSLPSYLASSQT